jgi:hypothetical protein
MDGHDPVFIGRRHVRARREKAVIRSSSAASSTHAPNTPSISGPNWAKSGSAQGSKMRSAQRCAGARANLAQPSGNRPMPHMRQRPAVKRMVVLVGPVPIAAMPGGPLAPAISASGVTPWNSRRLAHSGCR